MAWTVKLTTDKTTRSASKSMEIARAPTLGTSGRIPPFERRERRSERLDLVVKSGVHLQPLVSF
jgi:hypothetical protein